MTWQYLPPSLRFKGGRWWYYRFSMARARYGSGSTTCCGGPTCKARWSPATMPKPTAIWPGASSGGGVTRASADSSSLAPGSRGTFGTSCGAGRMRSA
eukprot:11078772-Lingulodinium_polyedra.AAC.1